MKKKTVLEAMKRNAINEVAKRPLLLLAAGVVQSENKETGEKIEFVRLDVEVPKECGVYGRCRFSVKVLGNSIPVSENELEAADFGVVFKNLEISYIDTQGNVYFRADGFSVKKGAQE